MKKKRSMSAPNPNKERATRADVDALAARLEAMRAEAHARVEQVRAEAEARHGVIRAELATKAEKSDLETLRLEMRAEFALRPTLDDLARHVNTIIEYLGTALTAVDEKYADLPARVTALETR